MFNIEKFSLTNKYISYIKDYYSKKEKSSLEKHHGIIAFWWMAFRNPFVALILYYSLKIVRYIFIGAIFISLFLLDSLYLLYKYLYKKWSDN